ncbi:MAG: ankyrin repeat domain-containing protein [Alphaproteobacteria bacterium]
MAERDQTAIAAPGDPASTGGRSSRVTVELVYRAITNNEMDALDSYIRQGLHLEAEKQGKSPLIFAIEKGKTAAALKLIEAGSNPDMQDSAQRTPLMLALPLGMNTVIERLLEKGAGLSLADKFNKTAADYARACDNSRGLQLVYKHLNADELRDELFKAIEDENTTVLRYLVEQAGVDFMGARNAKGQSPLEAADLLLNLDLSEYLTAKIESCGADAAKAVLDGTRDDVKAMKKIAIAPKSKI